MADAQNTDNPAGGEKPAEPQASGKKKKNGGKLKKFLLLLILAGGVASGLQMSGTVDFRPAVYSIVPKLPGIGPDLASAINVPAEYSLTPEERRRLELNEWEQSIAERERSLDLRGKELNGLSDDLYSRSELLDAERSELAARIEALSADLDADSDGGPASRRGGGEEEVQRIIRTFEEMSPKNAGAIIEKLDVPLAISVLDGLQDDFRARVLGKIDADKAAVLMQGLTERRGRR